MTDTMQTGSLPSGEEPGEGGSGEDNAEEAVPTLDDFQSESELLEAFRSRSGSGDEADEGEEEDGGEEGEESDDDGEEPEKSDDDGGEEEEEEGEQSDPLGELPENLQPFAKKFVEQDGSFTDDDYQELAELGYPRALVDRYLEGLRVETESFTNELFEITGGRDGYGEMVTWASKNLSEKEQKDYNKVLDTGNADAIKEAVAGLRAKYEAAQGRSNSRPPKRVKGSRKPGAQRVKPFSTQDEMVAAMSDPRYDTDEGFRKQVEARLAVTDL